MITQENANLGASLAYILDPKDLSIQAKPGTPLSVLVSAAQSMEVQRSLDNTCTPDSFAEELGWNNDNELLCEQADAMILAVSAATKRHLAFAKNVASPVVTEMVERTLKEMDGMNNDAISFEVTTRNIPLPLRNDALVSTIQRESTGSGLLPDADVKIPMLEESAIMDLLTSGSSTFDNDVKTWVTKIGMDFVLSVWGSVFSDQSGKTSETSYAFAQLINNDKTGIDAALLIFLFSQSLETNIPEGVVMPLARYNELLNQYRVAAIETMKRGLEQDASRNLSGQVVVSVNQVTKQIEVYEPTYTKWLEAGGVQEALAGMAISGQSLYNAASIDERKEDFIKAWDQYTSMQKSLFEVNSFNNFKSALVSSFKNLLVNPFEEEKEWFANSSEVDKVTELFLQEMKTITPDDLNDVNGAVLRLLGKSRFYYTDSCKILQSMKRASEKNPGIDAREAALIATIEYVSDYVADQMQLV